MYEATTATVTWLYIPEVTVDKASGFGMTSQFVFMLQLAMTFEYQLRSPMGIHGSLWLYGAVSIIGFFFMLFVVKDSSNLTDKEKKQLYWPKNTQLQKDLNKVAPIIKNSGNP